MAATRLRPRCRIVTDQPKEQVLDAISLKLSKHSNLLEGQVVQEHAFIRFPEQKQHYWSPELHIWAREQDGETIVYGVIGPKPKIWTMFMFLYKAVLTLALFGASYGLIQFWLGMEAPFLWSIPLGILAVSLVYLAAKYGQHRGRDQMRELIDFLEGSVEQKSDKIN